MYALAFLTIIISLSLSLSKDFDFNIVTYNSVVKLYNEYNKVRLHSHDIKYGSGSGQQSVTGVESKEDQNSYWLILNEWKNETIRGDPVKCNSIVMVKHLTTNNFLWSNEIYESPLSSNQEVSAHKSDNGHLGQNWQVICKDVFWTRTGNVMLKHVQTNSYLAVSGKTYSRPIANQKEICGVSYANGKACNWKVMEGAYFKPTEENTVNKFPQDEEDEVIKDNSVRGDEL
ncbi:unnamed protein product [Gordionus sp. m RMFG-2023]|uniref:stromal cell-derived factor 2-like n=1 Tax=Gordionus sp. m RMFG-2023 TaxID=3053472 RepID=UPI0030DE0D12